jgi:hypothetical protein
MRLPHILTQHPGVESQAALHMVPQVLLYGTVRALLRTARGLFKLASILFRARLVGQVEVRYLFHWSHRLVRSANRIRHKARAADFDQ